MKTIILGCLILAGCCTPTPPIHDIVERQVLVSVPCKVKMPSKPMMPFTESATVNDDIFMKTKKALAEIDVRKGYEVLLEAAADSCK